jgi:hypothetical protein
LLSVALHFFCIRACRYSAQPGLLLLAVVLVVIPRLSHQNHGHSTEDGPTCLVYTADP